MSASKWTPETRGAILERTAAGVSLADTCRALELRHTTVKKWITRGRSEDAGEYAEFVLALEQARESAHNRPEPMDADELAREVSEMVRKGSVTAAKLRWAMLRDADHEEPEAVDEFDELKARRRSA